MIEYNERIMGIFDTNKDARIGVLGHSPVREASQEYYEISIQRELGLTWHEWSNTPINERAKLVAHAKISKMVELAAAFKRWQHHQKERKEAKAKNPKKT